MMPPAVSLIICSYNQAAYIREAIDGALSQTYAPIEIIISDDCSSDNTFKIIEETIEDYSGPNKIILNRNDQNLGLIRHVNKVLEMASGDLIIGSAGDDISLPDRVETLVRLYKMRGAKPTLFHGDVLKIGSQGEDLGMLKTTWGKDVVDLFDTATRGSLYIGASSTFTKSLLRCFPPILYKNAYEDLVWGFRAALVGAVAYVDRPLVKYRVGVGISWVQKSNGNESLEDMLNRKRANKLVLKDVFAQRLLDLDHVDPGRKYKVLRRVIARKLLINEIDCLLMENPLEAMKYVYVSPFLLMGRFLSLYKTKRRFNKKINAIYVED